MHLDDRDPQRIGDRIHGKVLFGPGAPQAGIVASKTGKMKLREAASVWCWQGGGLVGVGAGRANCGGYGGGGGGWEVDGRAS